jgi:protein-S-isoprenylcysteine O-methyltransferase
MGRFGGGAGVGVGVDLGVDVGVDVGVGPLKVQHSSVTPLHSRNPSSQPCNVEFGPGREVSLSSLQCLPPPFQPCMRLSLACSPFNHPTCSAQGGPAFEMPHPHHTGPAGSSSAFRSLPSFHHAEQSRTETDFPESSAAPASNFVTAAEAKYFPSGSKSLAGIALRSFVLGTTLVASLAASGLLALNADPLWRLPFFWAALSAFHFLEFWTTAAYNTPAATIGSFLLTANWPAYFIAHSFASAECLTRNVVARLWPFSMLPPSLNHALLLAGFVLVLGGQAVRSLAMATAGKSFNHVVQHRKKDSHLLVTTGIYGFLRHPSYFGFFWWAVGTQLVLGNPLSFLAYALVMHRFFRGRIRMEEVALLSFFGDEYEDYRQRVGTKIPFVK